ncbi:MAG: ankyrin repeat domain-containing protein [Acidobacteriota bacterium]
MSTHSHSGPRPLPERPNLRHLKDQAKDLLTAGTASSLADAQFQIARLYGFASWPKLKQHVESGEEIEQLRTAIGENDFAKVRELMTRNPGLHHAPLGYANDGPLTMVAEWQFNRGWRDAFGREKATRLAMANWLIDNGSDVHQGNDGPLMRAALFGDRIPMMELLLARGANINAEWHGEYPILFAACETVDPAALAWLLDHGANPNCADPRRKYPGTALDYVIGSYVRSPELGRCISLLRAAGGATKYSPPAVLEILSGRVDGLRDQLKADPSTPSGAALVRQQFPELDFGTTGGRMLTLQGGTLLHVAAEYRNLDAVQLLLDHGADVNAPAAPRDGTGGQTPLFHAVTQNQDGGLAVVKLLVERGADLAVRARVPGHYERPGEVLECTPLGYALQFENEPNRGDKTRTVAFLRELHAAE